MDEDTAKAIRAARYQVAGTADCSPDAIPVLLREIDRLRQVVRNNAPAGDWDAMGVGMLQEYDDRSTDDGPVSASQ